MGRLLAGRYDELAVGLLLGLAATAVCLAIWTWCRRFRPGSEVPVVGLALTVMGDIHGPPLLDQPAQLCRHSFSPSRSASLTACVTSLRYSGPMNGAVPAGMP